MMMTKAWIWALIHLRALARDERGASLIEYALLIAVAVLVVFVAVRNFSNSFINATNFIATEVNSAVSGS